MSTLSPGKVPQTDRLVFSRFNEADAPAFARVLADPEVTRSIMAKATTAEQCLSNALPFRPEVKNQLSYPARNSWSGQDVEGWVASG
jgi:hypothetical protein